MTSALHLGPLESHHRTALQEIVASTSAFSPEEIAVAVELFDQRGVDYEFVGAFDGDRLVGYACFGATPSTDRTFDVYWVAVHRQAQGSGAGGALMREVERQLAARRGRMIVVETSSRDDYSATRRFYDKLGFVQAARLKDFYALGDDRVTFTKRVASFPSRDPQGTVAPSSF